MRFVDLRSDTVTVPTAGMREAMAAAPVGDDVYGEDPTVNRLEATVAALLGHEAGLFTGSGSLANMLGVRLHVQPGAEMLCDQMAHVVRAELGGHAAYGGVTTRTWASEAGVIDAAKVIAMATPDAGPYLVSTTCISVENTHNFGGGTIQPLTQLRALSSMARERGIALHLDGARLWNAHIATGVELDVYGALFDTVSVCLSKGLGAPVGSVLVGSTEAIAKARVQRKRMGGGMRQVGVLAAAGLYALDQHIDRLGQDHYRAGLIADALRPFGVVTGETPTNIVPLDLSATSWTAQALAAAAKSEGVLISVLGPVFARLVTHMDVNDVDIERASVVLARLLAE